jgi:hypothetical protein
MHYTFVYHLDHIMVENLLVVLCLVDRTPVEVEWQTPLTRFRTLLIPSSRLEWFEKVIS